MIAPIRVLIAKPVGNDWGAKLIASAWRDTGVELTATGLREIPEIFVNAVQREQTEMIERSVPSGAQAA